MKVDVGIVIVGLNARDFVRQCVESLMRAEWRACTYEVGYVDNGSTDGTPQMLRERFPAVKVLANEKNLGFCKAANQGTCAVDARYYFFLNDDTIVLDDAICTLVEWMDTEPRVGISASRLFYPDMREQYSGRSFPSPVNAIFGRRSVLSRLFPNSAILKRYLKSDHLAAGTPFPVDWVSAAAMMVRATTFEELGGLCEEFYYWHEAVFCDRAHKRGWKVMLHPKSRIIHYEGFGSGKRPYAVRKWHIIDFHKAAYRCYCEHYELSRFSLLRVVAAVGLGMRATSLLLANRLSTLVSGA